MRAVAFYTYNDNYILSNNPIKGFQGKNCKSRLPFKIKRKFPASIERRNSSNSKKTSEKFKYKNPELFDISKGSDPIEDCIFYYANGIIQMATLPKSAN